MNNSRKVEDGIRDTSQEPLFSRVHVVASYFQPLTR